MRVEVEFKDMPAWVQEQSAIHVGKNKRPICYVEAVEKTAVIGATWHDNARQVIVGRNAQGETVTISGGYYDSILNFNREEMAGYMGGERDLPVDGAILKISLYYKLNTITMYIRQDGPYMYLVNKLDDGEKLSDLQVNVLRHIAGLNSMGRKRERTDNHFPLELVIVVARELEEMGLCKVNKNGAITVTTAGRNKYRALPKPEWGWRDWREQHRYVRHNGRVVNSYGGFAGEIINEYRERIVACSKEIA